MKKHTRIQALCASACIALAGNSAHAALVYQQDFFVSGSADLSLTDAAYGWSGLVTQSGLTTAYTSNLVIGVSQLDYAFFAPKLDGDPGAIANNPALAYTTVPGAINISNLTSINWDTRADNIDSAFRVAIQVGGQWYASSTQQIDGRTDPTTFKALSYAPTSFATALNWLAIQNTAVSSSGTLSLGAAPGSDLSGNVTAYGLYLYAGVNDEVPGDHVRWDNFAINAVPEPSAAVLGGLGLLALLRRRR